MSDDRATILGLCVGGVKVNTVAVKFGAGEIRGNCQLMQACHFLILSKLIRTVWRQKLTK